MQDKVKLANLPLPSHRASFARQSQDRQDEDNRDDSDGSEESDEESGHPDDMADVVNETRNIALGLSDTSSTGSMASAGQALPNPPPHRYWSPQVQVV